MISGLKISGKSGVSKKYLLKDGSYVTSNYDSLTESNVTQKTGYKQITGSGNMIFTVKSSDIGKKIICEFKPLKQGTTTVFALIMDTGSPRVYSYQGNADALTLTFLGTYIDTQVCSINSYSEGNFEFHNIWIE